MYFTPKGKPKVYGCFVEFPFMETVWQENIAVASHYNPVLNLVNSFDARWKHKHMFCGCEWCHPKK